MDRTPKKINKCPIEESVFEIRFSSDCPNDAILGIVYSAVKDFFSEDSLQQLPVLEIPEHIRLQDPNLKYQPLHRLDKENFSLSIGPKTLIFGNNRQYAGWEAWSNFFKTVLCEVEKTGILKNVERIGLRYINVFDLNILKCTNIELRLNKNLLIDETSNLRTELVDADFIKILQVGNSVTILTNNKTRTGSIIDIDCIYDFRGKDFFSTYADIVDTAHKKEKELFFSLLNDDFINSLEPQY